MVSRSATSASRLRSAAVDQPRGHQAELLADAGRYRGEFRRAARYLDCRPGSAVGGRGWRAGLSCQETPMGGPMSETALCCRRPPELATTTLAVENMHCGGCMRKVETALAAVPGVASARANLSASASPPCHRRETLQATALIDALDRAGFRAAELAADAASSAAHSRPGFPAPPRRRRVRRRQHHAAVGVGVVGGGRRHDALGAGPVPLAVGADRPARGGLCGPAVLPLRRAGAIARAASTWTCRSRSA